MSARYQRYLLDVARGWHGRRGRTWRGPVGSGYLTAGATPVWLLGSFAVLSLLYRAGTTSGAQAPGGAEAERSGAGALTKRALAERAYTALAADSQRVSAVQLAEAAELSPSYARALAAEFARRRPAAAQRNGQPSNRPAQGGGR